MKPQYIILVLVWIVMVLVSGCATGGGSSSSSGSKKSRGSLSAATSQAAKKEPEEESRGSNEGRTRTKNEVYETQYAEETDDDGGWGVLGFLFGWVFGGDDEPEETYEPVYYSTDTPANSSYNEFGTSADGSGPQAKEQKSQAPRPKSLIFWYSPSWLAGDAIQGFSNFSLFYSVTTSRKVRVHIGPYFGMGTIGNQGNLREGLQYLDEWGLDSGFRVFLNPENPGREMYGMMGMKIGAYDWKYTNPIEAPDGGGGTTTLTHDGVAVFTPYLGLGTSFVKAGNFQMGVSFTLGVQLPMDETFEGYDNDVFLSVGEYKLNLEASYFF